MKPNMAIAAKPGDTMSDTMKCLHCGQALLKSPPQTATSTRFCCHGCEQVYQILASEDLTKYYGMLQALGEHAPSQSIREGEASANPSTIAPTDAYRYSGHADTYAVFVPGLTCAACLWLVQKALSSTTAGLHNLASVRLNLEEKLVLFTVRAGTEPEVATVVARLNALGYRAFPPRLSQHDGLKHTLTRRRLADLGIAGATFGNVMLFATAVYFGDAWGMSHAMASFFNYISLALALICLFTAGRGFFVTAWTSLRHAHLHIDLPIAVALGVALVVSLYSMATGGQRVYFDSITGLIFLLQTGRYLNESLQARAQSLTASATSLIPASGMHLKPGDEVVVKVGDIIPADGVMIAGATETSEAALTGEQTPKVKLAGDLVYAGSHNLVGVITVKVTHAGSDSYIARIEALVAGATEHRSTFETAAGRWLSWFIGGIFFAATTAGVIWALKDPTMIVEVVCATLIVSCPCALALATPLTMATALKRAWSHGVIIKSSEAIERAAQVDTIVLDKTGTLTTGQIKVCETEACKWPPGAAAALFHAASTSRHPVAKAVAAYCRDTSAHAAVKVASAEEIPGRGLKVSGHFLATGRSFCVTLGSAALVQQDERSELPAIHPKAATSTVHTAIELEDDKGSSTTWSQNFTLVDEMHQDVVQVIQNWRARGLAVHLLSGDEQNAVTTVADACGIELALAHGGVMPHQKAEYIQKLSAAGRQVLMVGDGVNDAAALSTASVGVAVSGGVDLALTAADVFLSRRGLAPVTELLDYARYTMQSLRLVLGLSVAYNIVAVALAVSGNLHPFIAAAIMPAASISIIAISALRQGDRLWKSSMSSCPLPSLSPAAPC